jgi:hypothetical protein
MENIRIKKFNKLSPLKDLIKPQNKKYFNDVKALYLNGKISRIDTAETLLNKLSGRGSATAIKKIQSFNVRQSNKIKKVKQPKISKFHLTADFLVRDIYYGPDEPITDEEADILTRLYFLHGGEGFKIPEAIKMKIYGKPYYKFIQYADTYHGSYNDCVHNLKEDIYFHYNKSMIMSDMSMRIDVIDFKNIYVVDESKVIKEDLKKSKMKASQYLGYSFIPENKTHLKNEGTCVDDNFLAIYKHVTAERFNELCNEVEIIDKSEGRTPQQLQHVCETLDISHYAYDILKKCFLKYVSKNRNHPALVYYCVNNHMYNISDKDEIKSLIETAKSTESKI